MKIKWLGHASFLITANDGMRIITDPFGQYAGLRYAPIQERADIVVISHEHGDHVGASIKGDPRIISDAVSDVIKGVEFKGLKTYHDLSKGRERGTNTVFCFTLDGLRVCHMGDLGHDFTDSDIAEIGHVDVLMIPVGGFYTIDAQTATGICNKVKPGIILPMHYKTDKCDFPISGVNEFLKGKKNVRRMDTSEIDLTQEQVREDSEIVVLKHAL